MAEIVFDKTLLKKQIHPAIDLIDDVLYFGLMLPIKTTYVKHGLCFVTSNKECFPASQHELDKRHLELLYPDIFSALRWNLDDVKKFLTAPQENNKKNFTSLLIFLVNSLKKYIELADEDMYFVVALWIIGTYLLPIWRTYPYLSISGAKRCGKSKLLAFLNQVAFNSFFSVDISTSTIYRLIQSTRCTLLIDEAEKLATPEKAEAMRNILNCGYKRFGKVYRSDKTKDTIRPRSFDVFSAKAFVSYEGIEDVTEDRCIQITMLRSVDFDVINSEIDELDEFWAKIRNKLYLFSLTHFKDIKDLYDSFGEPTLVSRERELWKPILVLAKCFGIYEHILQFALKESKTKTVEEALEARENIVLQALTKIVDEDRIYYITEIKNEIIESYNKENEPVPKWLSNNWIGRCLSRTFKLRESVQHTGKRGRRITRGIIENLCKRYGVTFSPSIYRGSDTYDTSGINGTEDDNVYAFNGTNNSEKSTISRDEIT